VKCFYVPEQIHQSFGGKMSSEVIITIIVAVTVIGVVILWQGMSIAKTQMTVDQTEQYRKLAEQATSAEQKAAEEQQKIATALEDMRARLAAIEKLLSDVQ
jgi:hypothetical protein